MKIALLILFCAVVPLFAAEDIIVPVSQKEAKAEYNAINENPDFLDTRKQFSWRMYVVTRLITSHNGVGSILVSLNPEMVSRNPVENYFCVISASDWYNFSQQIPKTFDSFLVKGHLLKKDWTWIGSKNGNFRLKVLYLGPDQITLNPDLPKTANTFSSKDEAMNARPNLESKTFVDRVVPLICAHWDVTEIMKEASAGFLNNKNEPANTQANFKKFNDELGPMTAYKGCEGGVEAPQPGANGQKLYADYLVQLVFQKGDAVLDLKLVQENDQWKISRYYVRSK